MGTGRECQEETRVISKVVSLKTMMLEGMRILSGELSMFSKWQMISRVLYVNSTCFRTY